MLVGRVAAEWRGVKVPGHAQDVLGTLLQGPSERDELGQRGRRLRWILAGGELGDQAAGVGVVVKAADEVGVHAVEDFRIREEPLHALEVGAVRERTALPGLLHGLQGDAALGRAALLPVFILLLGIGESSKTVFP